MHIMSMINTIITTYETKTNYLSMSCLSMSFHSDQFSVDSVCTEPIPFIFPHLPAVVLLKNTMFSLSYVALCHNLYSFGDLFIYILCICKDVGDNGEAFLFFCFCLFVWGFFLLIGKWEKCLVKFKPNYKSLLTENLSTHCCEWKHEKTMQK